jgi:hypothetical protein
MASFSMGSWLMALKKVTAAMMRPPITAAQLLLEEFKFQSQTQ